MCKLPGKFKDEDEECRKMVGLLLESEPIQLIENPSHNNQQVDANGDDDDDENRVVSTSESQQPLNIV